jgi:hypothetical protein
VNSPSSLDINIEFKDCLILRDNVIFKSQANCLIRLQALVALKFAVAGEQRAVAGEQRAVSAAKNILMIPGLQVDTANSTSVAVALMFVVLVMAAGILQCCGTTSPKPLMILLIFILFSFGLVAIVWCTFQSHFWPCIFVVVFSLIVCGAISVHFLHDDRLYLSQVWDLNTIFTTAAAAQAAQAAQVAEATRAKAARAAQADQVAEAALTALAALSALFAQALQALQAAQAAQAAQPPHSAAAPPAAGHHPGPPPPPPPPP